MKSNVLTIPVLLWGLLSAVSSTAQPSFGTGTLFNDGWIFVQEEAAGVPANILLRSKYRKCLFIHKGVLPANKACMDLIQPFTGVDKPKQAGSLYETDLFRYFRGSIKPQSCRNRFN